MTIVTTEKELGEALKNDEDTIEIEGDLVNKTVRIRATGKATWVIAIGAIGVAVAAIIATAPTAGASAPMALVAATGAASVLGSVTPAAIAIAVGAGGVAALNKLRSYKEVSRSDGRLVLKRK
jgi:hypothetical protein